MIPTILLFILIMHIFKSPAAAWGAQTSHKNINIVAGKTTRFQVFKQIGSSPTNDISKHRSMVYAAATGKLAIDFAHPYINYKSENDNVKSLKWCPESRKTHVSCVSLPAFSRKIIGKDIYQGH
jgi:hypothetical protein